MVLHNAQKYNDHHQKVQPDGRFCFLDHLLEAPSQRELIRKPHCEHRLGLNKTFTYTSLFSYLYKHEKIDLTGSEKLKLILKRHKHKSTRHLFYSRAVIFQKCNLNGDPINTKCSGSTDKIKKD